MTDRYVYRVMWSEEDGEYVGLCAEFPSLSHLDDTPEKAFAGIREVEVAAAVESHPTRGRRRMCEEPLRQLDREPAIGGTLRELLRSRTPDGSATPETHRTLAIDGAEAGCQHEGATRRACRLQMGIAVEILQEDGDPVPEPTARRVSA